MLGDASGAVRGLRATRMQLGTPDASGRRRPEAIAGSEHVLDCDVVIAAIGMAPDTRAFAGLVPTDRNGTLVADPATLETGVAGIFAAGDVVTGPSDITRAVGEGRRAAYMIDRWLQGGEMAGFDDRLPVVDKQAVVARQQAYDASGRPADHWRLRSGSVATSPRSSRR